MYIRSTIVALALTLSALSGAAHAGPTDDQTESAALANVSVTAADAIAAVVKLNGGTVVELSLDASGTPHYAVSSVASDGSEANFVVDAKTGAVVEVGNAWSDNRGGDGEAMDGAEQDGRDGEINDGGQSQTDPGDGDGETQGD